MSTLPNSVRPSVASLRYLLPSSRGKLAIARNRYHGGRPSADRRTHRILRKRNILRRSRENHALSNSILSS